MWVPTRKTITATLVGAQQEAAGCATITLERVGGRICFRFAWSGIGSPVAAHIHDSSGGCAVLPLFVDTPKRKGCVKAPKALIRKIADRPGDYEVTLHTQRHPHGALTAQLA